MAQMSPKPTPQERSEHGRVAALARHRPDSPQLTQARRDLAGTQLERYIKRVVDAAPPLSNAQRARLASLLAARCSLLAGGDQVA